MSQIMLTDEMDTLLVCSHESDLINFKFEDDMLYFRFAMPGVNARYLNDKIKADYDENLMIDVIFHNAQMRYFDIPYADFRFIACEVISFKLDEDGDFSLIVEDEYGLRSRLKFHSEEFEIVQKQIITSKQLVALYKQLDRLYEKIRGVVEADLFEIK